MARRHDQPLLSVNENGLYCAAGNFYVDPWRPVDRAVVTHAHADHARPGSKKYLTSDSGAPILRERLGSDASIEGRPFGEQIPIDGISVSLHPAGHILGSAQVRVEHRGEVWVVTGDYKTQPDTTCEAFELVSCHTLVTECTFGLPVYRWKPQEAVMGEIDAWWRSNRDDNVTTVLLGYSLGKSQRLIAGIDSSIGPIYCHGSVERMNTLYRDQGRLDVSTIHVSDAPRGTTWSDGIVIAPPGAAGTSWMRRFGRVSVGLASGWMAVRGRRSQRGADRGFVLSDHVDWSSLIDVIQASGCAQVLATHGYVEPVCRWLNENGISASPLQPDHQGDRAAGRQDATAEENE
jgi:putative mRNA 3-end processing factor